MLHQTPSSHLCCAGPMSASMRLTLRLWGAATRRPSLTIRSKIQRAHTSSDAKLATTESKGFILNSHLILFHVHLVNDRGSCCAW
jgi:hypothetical protein